MTTFETLNSSYPLLMAFVKFAILATFGEMLGLKIKTGKWNAPNYGVLPKAVIWGLLGMWIAFAMRIFCTGVPAFLSRYAVFSDLPVVMASSFSWMKIFGAFAISTMMNISFAPIFMTVHKITDCHIAANNGAFKALITPLNVAQSLQQINWKVQWNFVFKKSIPLFWIPAHTLTFLLPQNYQVLFAAVCSIILGLILSIAAKKN
jgi:hypothetical protein